MMNATIIQDVKHSRVFPIQKGQKVQIVIDGFIFEEFQSITRERMHVVRSEV